jgi:hypothetical protein
MTPKLVVSRKTAVAKLSKQIADGEALLKWPIRDSATEYQQFQDEVRLWKSYSISLVGTLFDTDEEKRRLSFSSTVALPHSPIPKKWEQFKRETNFFLVSLRSILNNLELYKRETSKKRTIGRNLSKEFNHKSVDQLANMASGDGVDLPISNDAPRAVPLDDDPGANVSLRNFHVDANLTDTDMLRRSDGFLKNLVASFRQVAANGGFTFGPVKLQDADLNRVHGIVTEIDARRLFYACGEDEVPRYAMESLYEARKVIRDASKGVWANPSCEVLVQEITAALADFCSKAEKQIDNRDKFYNVMTDMRLKVWLLVAMLKKKLGSVLNPRNLPVEIWKSVRERDI